MEVANLEDPPWVLVGGGHDALVDGGGLLGGLCVVGQGEAVDDLAGGDDLGEAGLDLDQGTGELLDLTSGTAPSRASTASPGPRCGGPRSTRSCLPSE